MTQHLRYADIKAAVALEFEVLMADLDATGPRTAKVVAPRHLAFKLCREMTAKKSYPRIAQAFGGFDHTTIVTGVRSANKRIDEDPEYRDRAARVVKKLNALVAEREAETLVDG